MSSTVLAVPPLTAPETAPGPQGPLEVPGTPGSPPAEPSRRRRRRLTRYTKKGLKRIVPVALGLYFIPWVFGAYVLCGLLDVMRNRRRTLGTIDRYFAGNGLWTWLFSPFNLFLDALSLPYRNRGVYRLTDLPAAYQQEIRSVIDTAHRRDLVGLLGTRLGEQKRGMIFFKWYGKNLPTTVDVPEYHEKFRYVRTIGVSIFNKRSSTSKHYGPLRISFRVLYNLNPITDPNVYIRVGNVTHRWRDDKLFIFDDTLQHQSCNESDGLRYCLFVDILRPSLVPWLLSAFLTTLRLVLAPFLPRFFKRWSVFR